MSEIAILRLTNVYNLFNYVKYTFPKKSRIDSPPINKIERIYETKKCLYNYILYLLVCKCSVVVEILKLNLNLGDILLLTFFTFLSVS